MKIRSMLFITSLIGQCIIVSAQQYATDKRATIIAGKAGLISSGGDLFEDSDGNKSTIINITPTILHFITNNFYVGGGVEITTHSQGEYSSNAIGLGPQIGYMLGGPHSKAMPYLDINILYYRMNIDYSTREDTRLSGSIISPGFGVIIPIKTHIGLFFEGRYKIIDLRDNDTDVSISGNVLSIGIGIAGLLFQSEK